jgi:hypothetical protein
VEGLSLMKELHEPWSSGVVQYWATDNIKAKVAAFMPPYPSSVMSSDVEDWQV